MDHGVLNVPLAKRGNIDAQIDRFKAQQAAERRTDAKVRATVAASERATAKQLLSEAPAERIAHLAARCNVSVPAMRKRLQSDAHWQPMLVIRLLQPIAA